MSKELEYKELSKLNITRLIENAYNNNIELPQDFVKNINFHEKGQHKFMLDNQTREIEESLALNCITTLPFHIYKKYVTTDWILDKNLGSNPIEKFHYHGSYEFLDYLLDICIEHNKTIPLNYKERNKEQSNFHYKYNNDFLDMLINFERLTELTGSFKLIKEKENTENNFKLFKKALKEKFSHAEIERNSILEENETSKQYDPENWFKHYNYIKNYSRCNLNLKDFIENLVMQPQKSSIFFDIMKQYENEENNPFLVKEVFDLAFKYQNTEVVKYISPYISQKDKVNIFYDICEKWYINTARDIYQCVLETRYFENKEYAMHGGKMNFVKWYINTIQKIAPEHEIEWDKTGYILLNVNEKFFNELLEKNPKIKTANLVENYNIDYFKVGINVFNDLVDSYGYGENYKLNESIKYQYILHLSEIYKPEKTIYLERNQNIKYFIIDNLLRRNPDDNTIDPKYTKNMEELWEILNFSEELEKKVLNKTNVNTKKKQFQSVIVSIMVLIYL